MEEKLKIYIPEAVNAILLKDMERFEFYKKDGTFNKNEFYNTLVLNYHEQYQENQSALFDYIKQTAASNFDSSNVIVNDVASKILSFIDLKSNMLDEQKSEVTISIKPTKLTSDIFDFIQNYSMSNSTLSSYFRNMFASYTILPQDKREKIIFKQNFEVIEKAIKEDKKLYFTTINNRNPHIASPYSVANSKEELFNYLLCCYDNPNARGNKTRTFRISRLRKITILNETREIPDYCIELFKRMEEHGPQYTFNENNINGTIKVLLTEDGKRQYKSIYLHRPKYTKIEGDYYYFECSATQAFQYFSRFGKEAIVIEPTYLKDDLIKYYLNAKTAYLTNNK